MKTVSHMTSLVTYAALILVCSLWTPICSAQLNLGPATDEDTILVEKEASQSISYHQLVRLVTKKLFQTSIDAYLSGGKTRSSASVRNFKNYMDQMHYRINVHSDSVQVRFSLNF